MVRGMSNNFLPICLHSFIFFISHRTEPGNGERTGREKSRDLSTSRQRPKSLPPPKSRRS